MKITRRSSLPATFSPTIAPKTQNPSLDLDLSSTKSTPKPPRRRRNLNAAATRRRKGSIPAGKRSRPETPLLKWKIEEDIGFVGVEDDDDVAPKGHRRGGRRGREVAVPARKLAARLWRLQLPEVERSDERLGFQPAGVCHVGLPFVYHRGGKERGSELKDVAQSPCSFSGSKNGFMSKHEPSFQNVSLAMEGATKWDPVCSKVPDEVHQIHSHKKLLDQQASTASTIASLQSELQQARARIQELESERGSSKKKMEHFLKKVSEERAAWRSREHEKVRAFIEDAKAEANRERKNRQRIEIANSKLVNELADAKLSAKRLMQDCEKERKARELMEEVCDELANEIGEDKEEAEALKEESMKFREELEDERKMLQMAEVWREERVQMKLVDVKLAVEEKYSQMNKLVSDLEAFLKSRSAASDMKESGEAELLREEAASINIQEIKEFSYEPPNPEDIFSIFEGVDFGESNEKEIDRGSNEEDESGWETASHLEDRGSSYSPEGSTMSEKEPRIIETNEIRSIPKKQAKKLSSIARLWKSIPNNGDNYKIVSVEGINNDRLSNARLSNGSVMSLDRASQDFTAQWSSPESGNPHVNRGRCIEWPRGVQRHSLKAKLLEARMDTHKVQLRHVLKQKI